MKKKTVLSCPRQQALDTIASLHIALENASKLLREIDRRELWDKLGYATKDQFLRMEGVDARFNHLRQAL